MDQSPPTLTVRSVAKHLAESVVGMGTSVLTVKAVDNYTGYDKDAFVVKIGAGAVGFVVAGKLKPYTDTVVDKTADFIVEKREARKAKKNPK